MSVLGAVVDRYCQFSRRDQHRCYPAKGTEVGVERDEDGCFAALVLEQVG